jgi:hypothetical protein
MKIENIKKAGSLLSDLERVERKIEAVNAALDIRFFTGHSYHSTVNVLELKHNSAPLVAAIRAMVLASLLIEKEDILQQVKDLN